ncbi:hypothetical protein [Rhizobium sp. MHM7A]|uniref:hypothetical protein n=1 Tax=Rhizobium sp. MHM7A TaxID=2583233 RepID=UPI0011070B5B|nr:hypothetical protein [Rhizobium sp. MHM7A]TLX15866.1 hypothetical protein FFR93_00700 [Rhizobium sp. MHM7A]
MHFEVRCYEHVINGQSSTLAISDEIELPHRDGVNYLTLCLNGDQLDIVLSNFRNLPDTSELDNDLEIIKREISTEPVDVGDFSIDKLTWTTRHLYTPETEHTIAPEEDVIALAVAVLREPGVITDFLAKASDALASKLDDQIAEAWKAVHDLTEARDRARLLKLHLPSLKTRKTIQRRDDSYIEFGRGMGETSSTPPAEDLDELFAQGVSNVHIEMMSDEHAWFGIRLVNGRYFHGSLTGKGLRVQTHEESDV